MNSFGFDSIHTIELNNKNNTSDEEINEISIRDKRIVISKDSDFYNRYLIKNEPYKLIIISTGNISNNQLIDLIKANLKKIILEIEYNFVIEISQTSIITII